jgi:hypothetical protein
MEQAFKVLRTARNSPFWPCAEFDVFSACKKQNEMKNMKE